MLINDKKLIQRQICYEKSEGVFQNNFFSSQRNPGISIMISPKLTGQKGIPQNGLPSKRVMNAFIKIFLVFIFSYLPTIITTLYMNKCGNCNCIVIHIARDIAFLSLLTGAFFRGFCFICLLKPLQKNIHTSLLTKCKSEGNLSPVIPTSSCTSSTSFYFTGKGK